MDNNTGFVLSLAFVTSIFWLPILLKGIENIVRAWRCRNAEKGDG